LDNKSQKIAVIGGGIAGLSAAWLLNQRYKVKVFEKADKYGGHANTVSLNIGSSKVQADTGFIVYNELNYPNLVALFNYFSIQTQTSDMSFSISSRAGNFEYSSKFPKGLFGQRTNLLRPWFWNMLFDIKRFYKNAPIDLRAGNLRGLTIRDYLDKEYYSYRFIVDHILPMGAAIWSSPSLDINNYPAESFVRFFESHNLLKLGQRSSWRTVSGGSRKYIERLTANFTDKIFCNVNVKKIIRNKNSVEVVDDKGNRDLFDDVILAVHADEALKLICNPSKIERQLLGKISYTCNSAFLHTDVNFMPKRKNVWASWNYINNQHSNSIPPQVTYWISSLQNLSSPENLFLTLNPKNPPCPSKTFTSIKYHHPLFTSEALKSQRQLLQIQGKNKAWFCGSYFGHGFHEDALQSGLWVAEKIGKIKRPWSLPGQNDRLIAIND